MGFALTALSNTARYTIGLTGTLFAGYATSIFWLLYRLCPEIRQSFAFNDERRWTERYGLLKHTFYTTKDTGEVNEDGAFTGTKFFETVSERPGISPAIAGVGLKYCTFSSLKDVGLPLPHYGEEIVRLDLTPAMRDQYARADGSAEKNGLFAWALNRMEDEDGKGAISVWLNTALNRPDAMFRGEPVVFRPRVSGRGRFAIRRTESVATFEPAAAAGEWLPKEEWTARTCLAELQLGRKTLVYVRQTGNRDIQERLAECLKARGLRVGVLRPSLAPEKRASWIKKHATEFDVLLTNARLIEVGLNLTMFSTGVFYELEWSLAIVWQAMRRLFRPGALRPVKLYFPVYRGTLEEAALDLIGAKMLAAITFYGDEASGALVEESDQGNLLNDIVRKAMGELQVGRAEGIFSLGNDMLVTDSPLGSPTAISPQVLTFAELVARRRELLQPARRAKRPAALAENPMQPSLF